MGRYSSVQAYADNNQNVRSITYDQATGGGDAAASANKQVVTEKVSNPYGSAAGAGSGEFHVYRHARAREAARWKELDESEQQKQKEQEFQMQLQHAEKECETKTAKNRRKRQREKEAKFRKKNLIAAGIVGQTSWNEVSVRGAEEEFSYQPEHDRTDKRDAEDTGVNQENAIRRVVAAAVPLVDDLPNDGSFLEIMKKKLRNGGNEENTDDEEGAMLPPPTKKILIESRIIDEDDEEGPMPLR